MKTFKIVNGIVHYDKIETVGNISAAEIINYFESSTFSEIENNLHQIFKNHNIRISKINLNFNLEICAEEDKITIKISVIKNNTKYQLSNYNRLFLDYYIDREVFHCVHPSIHDINLIINELQIDPNNLSFPDYVKIVKKLGECDISFVNSLANNSDSNKKNQTDFEIEGIQFPLYQYQTEGCNWMNYMVQRKCGVILGDEMGLGKTLQIIALMGQQKQLTSEPKHFLIVCPISLLENWIREIRKFLPSLTAILHYGRDRSGYYQDFLNYDVIITTYTSVISDLSMINMINWDMVILDEAQNIKNPHAKRTKSIKKIHRKIGIAVTGTLFENHFTDVWSITDFVLPNYLGNLFEFENKFHDDNQSAVKIEKIISPIMIRRTVAEVAGELPPKVIIPQPIIMSEIEASLYENQRSAAENLLMIKKFSLPTIQNLRMFCTHPCVYDNTYSETNHLMLSRKYERAIEILNEIYINKDKVIIFTSFTKMIELFLSDLKSRYNGYVNFIHGETKASNRQLIIDEFSKQSGFGVLIINPKAGGAGLNITAANHVIHYNLEWNPAVEDQATARAYRRGQVKTVFVYRLYYSNTIEEVINEKIERKRELSDLSIVGNSGNTDESDLIKAYKISPI